MMSAKLPSLGLTREEALRDATEELPAVSSNRSESGRARGDATEKQRKKTESKRRATSTERSNDLLLLLPLPPSTMVSRTGAGLNTAATG